VISNGAAIWGHKEFTCISAVQNRAMRFFLGVGKYTPNAAVLGEMGWIPPSIKQWTAVAAFWSRMSCTNSHRLNKRISLWASDKARASNCRNRHFWLRKHLATLDLNQFNSINEPISKPALVKLISERMFQRFANDWLDQINAPIGPSRRGRNKLRTYCQFKHSYSVENYCSIVLPPSHRSAFSKFRCGVAPIRIETGRFEGLPEERRLCPFCNVIEDESHVTTFFV